MAAGPHPLSTIYFYLTRGCNLACRHCWISAKPDSASRVSPEIPEELFRSVVEQAKPLGLRGLKLTGGEPLIHSEIEALLAFIAAEKLALTVETNAVLCTPDMSRRIADCQTKLVSVSLDGANSESHDWMRGVQGSFEEACRGIRNLTALELPVQIVMTVTRRTRDEMEPLVDLAMGLGARYVKFNFVQATGRGVAMEKKGETLGLEELISLGAWVEDDLAPRSAVRVRFNHPLAFRRLDGKPASQSCSVTHLLGVLGDGSYSLCGMAENEPDLIFGNAARDSLEEVWQENPVLREIREGFPHRLQGICSRCRLRNACGGHCMAQNYHDGQNLWSGFWYCEEALARGLFPTEVLIDQELADFVGHMDQLLSPPDSR